MSHIEKEKLIKADIASIENRVRHTFNQGYDLGFKDGKKRAKPLEQEPTTKNDLGVDLVSRADVLKLMQDNWHTHNGDWAMQESMDDIRALPSVTPQEPKIVPIAEIKYDKDKLKELVNRAVLSVIPQEPSCDDVVSRDVVKKQMIMYGFHAPDMTVTEFVEALPSVTPQEPKILALLDKTFDDFCNCPGGESYFHIDGEDYNTDAGYALEVMEIFIKVLKKRLAESEG